MENEKTIEISEENVGSSTNKKYSDGKYPSVAANSNGIVVEVHETSNIGTYTLYYKVGIIEGGKISWGDDQSFDKGFKPSVAITNEGVVTTVHETTNSITSSLYYRLGQVEGKKIIWSDGL